MRVLVTGSSGFVGGWLTRHLAERGDEVVPLDEGVDITDGRAVRDAVAEAEPEAVCHLAAQASVAASWDDAAGTWSVNATGVVNLLEAVAARPRPARVLLVSSAEVYGTLKPVDLPVREERAFAPANPYAASKAAAELAGLQAWLGRGLEVVRARPFNHTGPGQRPDYVVPALARQVVEAGRRNQDHVAVGNLDVRRDISDVRDVVRAYRDLLELGEPGGVYNVCRGESIAIAELLARLLELAGLDLEVRVDPARLRPADIPDLRGDPGRLRAATGWVPEIPLEATLRDVLAYWRETPAP